MWSKVECFGLKPTCSFHIYRAAIVLPNLGGRPPKPVWEDIREDILGGREDIWEDILGGHFYM